LVLRSDCSTNDNPLFPRTAGIQHGFSRAAPAMARTRTNEDGKRVGALGEKCFDWISAMDNGRANACVSQQSRGSKDSSFFRNHAAKRTSIRRSASSFFQLKVGGPNLAGVGELGERDWGRVLGDENRRELIPASRSNYDYLSSDELIVNRSI